MPLGTRRDNLTLTQSVASRIGRSKDFDERAIETSLDKLEEVFLKAAAATIMAYLRSGVRYARDAAAGGPKGAI